jgi:hypothetical protein
MENPNETQVELLQPTNSYVSQVPASNTTQTEILPRAVYFQELLFEFEGLNYVAKWDGQVMRLLQPLAANAEEALITYKILGHIDLRDLLPKVMDQETFNRQAYLLVTSYKEGLE